MRPDEPRWSLRQKTGHLTQNLLGDSLSARKCHSTQTASYKNFASVFNLTLVGGFVVPGSHKDSLFAMEGVLLDVDNGYLYTAMQAEGLGKIMRPTFVIEEKDAITLAKTRAVAAFGDEVLKRMRVLATLPPPSDRAGRIIIEGTEPTKPTDGKAVPISNPDLRPLSPSDVPALKPTPVPLGAAPLQPSRPQPYISDINTPTSGVPVDANGFEIQSTLDAARRAQRNAGGVMTGITVPRPLP